MISHKQIFIIIILLALFLRLLNFSFPAFTSNEARIAYRGYTLATTGKDELGRAFPILFNSLTDYQLPAVSYISALGVLVGDKTDFAVRIPFTIISVLIVILIYKISGIFNQGKEFRIFCAFIAAFTPAFIFLSKTPNETILLTFSFLLLFLFLTKKQANLFAIGFIMMFACLISKLTWWVLIPFTGLTLAFFQTNFPRRTKVIILTFTILLTVASITIFLQVPQSKRSFMENDFPIFRETSIKVVTDRLRGQGLTVDWPDFLEKIFFNKLQFISIGFLNWIYHLELAALFGQFDETGTGGFVGMGAFPKIAIVPFLGGLIMIIKKGTARLRALFFYLLIFTFPVFFMYPDAHQEILVPALPFLILIIALGLVNLQHFIKYAIVFLILFEVSINIIFLSPQIKNTNYSRSLWIKQIVKDGYNLSVNDQVAISDDLTLDIASFLEWYTLFHAEGGFKDIQFPYKFRQTQVGNIKIIGFDDTFYFCGLDQPTYVFASRRDLEKIKRWLNINTAETVKNIYMDNLNNEVAYLLQPTICIH